MKKILLIILVLISVQSFGQMKFYARRINSNATIDSFYNKQFTDSLFDKNNNFIQFTREHFDGQFNPTYPNGFENYIQRADGIWENVPSQFESGEYTPTLFNTSNVAASTAFVCNYFRIGNKVLVSGAVSIDADLAASTELQMSLPISSNLTAVTDLGGNGSIVSQSVSNQSLGVRANTANDRAAFIFLASLLANNTYAFTFSYTIK